MIEDPNNAFGVGMLIGFFIGSVVVAAVVLMSVRVDMKAEGTLRRRRRRTD